MTRLKQAAREVVEAMPDDADLSDLAEFLFEREMVETGRDDFVAGRTLSRAGVAWSQQADRCFKEVLSSARWRSTEEARCFEVAVEEAAMRLGKGVSLPEMGDPRIREVRVASPLISYRVVFETVGGAARVLWFTNNQSCYRNVRR
jgi:hypothetical protein